MSSYRRNHNGQFYFFTIVTHQRRPILTTELGRMALRSAIRETRAELPFQLTAIVLLPDHLHTIWELPADDLDYSTRWRILKTKFSKQWRRLGGALSEPSQSRQNRGELAVWQRRLSILAETTVISRDVWIISMSIRSSMVLSHVCVTGPGRRFIDT